MNDLWNDAKGVLGTVAPMLATAVGGPLAGMATGTIIKALGLAPDTPTTDVVAAVAGANADQLLALKKAESDFQTTMAQLNIDASKLVYDDKANARQRETSIRDHTPAIMGFGIVGAFIGMTTAVLLGYAPADTVLAGTLLGYVSAKAEQVVSYYFGSSAGSSSKDKLIANSVPMSSVGTLAQSPFGSGQGASQ